MSDQKALIIDIETSPLVAYAWGRRDVNIALNQIKEEWCVMAFAAKWLGDPASKIIYKDKRHDKTDLKVIKAVWKLLDEADILITQNGQSFDTPKLNARFIMYGMQPPSPYKHLDTYRIARKAAAFTSNKLEYLTDKLCVKYKKLSHSKYPGMELWTECLKGNMDAWNEMERYNKHDVLSTEELYLKIRAWAPPSTPSIYTEQWPSMICRICGKAGKMQKAGVRVNRKSSLQRWKCQECGSFSTGDKVNDR